MSLLNTLSFWILTALKIGLISLLNLGAAHQVIGANGNAYNGMDPDDSFGNTPTLTDLALDLDDIKKVRLACQKDFVSESLPSLFFIEGGKLFVADSNFKFSNDLCLSKSHFLISNGKSILVEMNSCQPGTKFEILDEKSSFDTRKKNLSSFVTDSNENFLPFLTYLIAEDSEKKNLSQVRLIQPAKFWFEFTSQNGNSSGSDRILVNVKRYLNCLQTQLGS